KLVLELPLARGVARAAQGAMFVQFRVCLAGGCAQRGLPCAQRGAQPYKVVSSFSARLREKGRRKLGFFTNIKARV
ncbi:hypothetical protein A2U01_0058893, partial [Trifolium medium]|nr:hypothetical protein [Trifolium medium]